MDVSILICMRKESCLSYKWVTHSCEWAMSPMNQSLMSYVSHKGVMSHVSYECVMSCLSSEWVLNESCLVWISHAWIIFHMNKSCLIWISHAWVMFHMYESWVMAHTDVSCRKQGWKRMVQRGRVSIYLRMPWQVIQCFKDVWCIV